MPSTGAPADNSASLICGEPASPYRLGAAREDDALRRERRDLLGRRVPRQDLAVDAYLAHAPRDQLRVLAAEIDDEDSLGVAWFLAFGADVGGLRHTSER